MADRGPRDPNYIRSAIRLRDAFVGAHLGYGVAGPDGGLVSTVASLLGAPAIWRGHRTRYGEDIMVMWVWYPAPQWPPAWAWPAALPYGERILDALASAVSKPEFYSVYNRGPEPIADTIRADRVADVDIFGVGNPGLESG